MSENIPRHTTWIEIDLEALRHNFRQMKRLASPAEVIAVVKSEAYGHGMETAAQTLAEEGAWGFAVVCADEAERLRRCGITAPIVIIAPTPRFNMERIIMAGEMPNMFFVSGEQPSCSRTSMSSCAIAMPQGVRNV